MITKYQSTNARRLMLGTASILAVSAGLLMVNAADNGSNASAPAAASSGAPKGWWKNGTKPEAYDVGIDPTQPYKQPISVYVKSLDPKIVEGNFGGMMQMCRAESFRGKRLKLTGFIKTLDVVGTANFWFRVDGEVGKMLAFDNMSERPIKGTTDWKEYSVVLDVPENANALAYGIFIAGAGMAWLNDVQLIEVDSDVKSTNMEKSITSPQNKLPDAPQNLDFSNGKSSDAANGDPKAEQLIIPKIAFTDVSVEKALEFLRAKSRELDPEKKGVEIILKDSQKSKDTAITLTMVDMPLFEAVKYVGEAANLDVNWVGKAIVLTSRADVESSKGSTPDDRKTQASNPDVLARVNNVAITIDQLNLVAGKRENEIRQKFTGEDRERQIAEARKQALNDLIDRELILQEFEQQGLYIDQKIFDDRISEIAKKEFGGDKAALRAAVEKQGFSWEQFMKWEREKIIIVAMRESNTRGESEMKAREAKEEKWLQSLRDKASIQLLAER